MDGLVESLPPGISVVVPVYGGAPTLDDLAEQLTSVLGPLGAYEIIFVVDASPDDSWERVVELNAADGRVRGVLHSRNFGQHNALLAGIRVARFATTVTVDDDLQHPPVEIPKLLSALDAGADVVYGTPLARQHGLWRNAASMVTKAALQGAMGTETASKVSAFRAFRTHLREAFSGYHGPMVSIDVLLTWGTTRFEGVEVRHDPRRIGESNYTFRSLVVHAVNMATGFSTRPLQLASYVGFIFALFGVGVLVYVVGRTALNGGSVPGFPFVASIIAVFSGAQLFALGIIGEYLARMHFRLLKKPTYVISAVVGERTEP